MAVEIAWVAHRVSKPSWVLAFGTVAILWNPIWKIEFLKETWVVLDVAASVLLLLSVRYVREIELFRPLVLEWLRRRRVAILLAILALTFGAVIATTLLRHERPSVQASIFEEGEQRAQRSSDTAVSVAQKGGSSGNRVD